MTLWSVLRCLLPVFAIAGIILGPFTTLMNGHTMAVASMPQVPDDMASCRDGRPVILDSGTACPLTTVCAAKCFPSIPILSISACDFRAIGDPIPAGNDVFGNPFAETPLDRPPRT